MGRGSVVSVAVVPATEVPSDFWESINKDGAEEGLHLKRGRPKQSCSSETSKDVRDVTSEDSAEEGLHLERGRPKQSCSSETSKDVRDVTSEDEAEDATHLKRGRPAVKDNGVTHMDKDDAEEGACAIVIENKRETKNVNRKGNDYPAVITEPVIQEPSTPTKNGKRPERTGLTPSMKAASIEQRTSTPTAKHHRLGAGLKSISIIAAPTPTEDDVTATIKAVKVKTKRKAAASTKQKHTCIHCSKVYSRTDKTAWIHCDTCGRWMHGACDGLTNRDVERYGQSDQQYKCKCCGGSV